jgi:hypothetical protein
MPSNQKSEMQVLEDELAFFQKKYIENRGINENNYKYYYKYYCSIKKKIENIKNENK